jgi:hypothetical protein
VAASVNNDGFISLENKVELLPYQPRPFIERAYLSDAEILNSTSHPAFVDIEIYPNYYLCSFKINGKFVCLECGEGREFNARFLSWLLYNYKTIGFNSINYDLLMIWLSYRTQDTGTLKDASNSLITQGMRPKDLKQEYEFATYKTSHIDLIEVAPLKGSLKLYGARLHSPRLQDLPFPDNEPISEQQIEIVRQYNFNDLDVTEQLFDFMKERLELRQVMSVEYNEDLMSKSDAQIAEVILAKEVGKLNGKRPKRQEIEAGTVFKFSVPSYIRYQSPELNALLNRIRTAKFIVGATGKIALPEELKASVKINAGVYRLGIGGLHSSETNVAYQKSAMVSIVDRDVASYYPRLLTTLKLYPPSCGENFLVAFNKLIDIRLEAKAKKHYTRDKGLKIVINGTSGKLSDVWSTFYSPDNTIQMTVSGQLALLMFIEMLEINGIEVISANTDGIVMLVHKDKECIYENTYKDWERITGFTTEETRYRAYFARDVNAYFAVKTDGTVKKKGPYSEIGSQSGTKLDTNPTSLICSDAIEALLSKGIPVEQTIQECKDFTRFVTVRQVKGGAHKAREYLGKVVRWAYIKGESGTINYVTNGNKVADSDGAVPFQDMPTKWPDIDYQWYENKCKEILEEIGYLPKPKQLSFF